MADLMGLRKLIYDLELPHADQNAMADIEGRPRQPRVYGGIDRGPAEFWLHRYHLPTAAERFLGREYFDRG